MKKILGPFLLLSLAVGCALPVSQTTPQDVMVAVGAGGMIARSTDHGTTWQVSMGTQSKIWNGGKTDLVVDGNCQINGELNRGRFAQIDALASSMNQLLTSGFVGDTHVRGTLYQQLGKSWVGPIANPFGVSNITAAAYMGGVYVAGGQLKKLSRSLDYGATWSALIANPFAAGSRISGMASGGGVFVAVTDAGEIAWSTNGDAPWTSAVTNPFGGLFLGTVTYGNGVFVAAGGSKQIGYSLDNGKNWTLAASNPFTAGTIIETISFGVGVIVAGNNTGQIARSTDLGVTWGSLIANPFAGQTINSGVCGNGVFVLTANNGEIARSVDLGKTWGALITNPFGASSIWCVSYNFGIFQAGANGGLTARSYDSGVTWGGLASNPFGANAINAMASTQGDPLATNAILAVGGAGSIATSGWNAAYSLVEPVPGEPSLGTPHHHYVSILNTNPADALWHAVNAITVGALPAGTKAVQIYAQINGITAGRQLYVGNDGATILLSVSEGTVNANWDTGNGFIPLDASGQVWWRVTNADVASAILIVTDYWI